MCKQTIPDTEQALKTRILLSWAALAILSACGTVGPNYNLPQQAVLQRPSAAAQFLGSNDTAYTSEPLPAQWWRLYQDPVLDGLIQQALAANTDLRVAAANLARTQAVAQEVEAGGRPVVAVSAAPSYGRASGAANGTTKSMPAAWSHDGGLTVAYQADMFGRLARAMESANADTQSAQAAADLVRITVAAETARAYADACSALRQMTVVQHSIDLQQHFVTLTDRRMRGGRGAAIEGTRARSQLAQLQSGLPPLQSRHLVAHYRLAALTGLLPAEMDRHLLQCQAAPRLVSSIPVGDGAALLRRRPDVRQAERNLASATARIGMATADLYPNITFGLGAGSAGSLSSVGAANAFRWSLGPVVSWTLPSTGSARSRIMQAEAGTDSALAHFDGVVINALKEVESAMTVYAHELSRNGALKTARDESARASAQSQQLYRYGRIDFLSALDSERTLAASDAALAESDAQLTTDQIALFLALGGGWEAAAIQGNASNAAAM